MLLPDVDCCACLLPSVTSHIWECCGLENDKLHSFLPVSPGGKDSTEAAAGVCGVHRIQRTAFDPGGIYRGWKERWVALPGHCKIPAPQRSGWHFITAFSGSRVAVIDARFVQHTLHFLKAYFKYLCNLRLFEELIITGKWRVKTEELDCLLGHQSHCSFPAPTCKVNPPCIFRPQRLLWARLSFHFLLGSSSLI